MTEHIGEWHTLTVDEDGEYDLEHLNSCPRGDNEGDGSGAQHL